jgi:hypothetical protein
MRCTAHLPERAIKTQSRRNQDLQGDAHLPELALRRPERLFERLLLIGQPPPLSLDRVLSTARLRVRESTQRGTFRGTQRGRGREAHSEALREAEAERHIHRGTQRGRGREAHSEALTTKSLDAPQRARQPQAARWSQHSRARAPDEGGHQRVISGNQMVPQRSRALELRHRELIKQRALRNCMLVVQMA